MNWQFWLAHRSPSSSAAASDDCETIRPLLSLMTDQMASPHEKRQIDTHLSACAECRKALSWMEATRLAIVERPAVLPPIDMRDRIARAIAASAQTAVPAVPIAVQTPVRSFTLRPAYAAALSLAVLGAFLGHSLLTAHPAVLPPSPVAPIATVKAPAPVVAQKHSPIIAPRIHRNLLATVVKTAPRETNQVPVDHQPAAIETIPVRRAPVSSLFQFASRPRPELVPEKSLKTVVSHKDNMIAYRPLVLHGVAPRPETRPLVAIKPPAEQAAPVLTHTEPAPTQTPEVQVASANIPSSNGSHPAMEDALSSVRALLPSRHAGYAHQLGMDTRGLVHTVAFVQQPITYLDTKAPSK